MTEVAKHVCRTKNITEVIKNVTEVANNVCRTKKVTEVTKNVTEVTKMFSDENRAQSDKIVALMVSLSIKITIIPPGLCNNLLIKVF